MKTAMAICGIALLFGQSVAADEYRNAADCEAYARKIEREQGRVLGGAARGSFRGALVGGILGQDKEARQRGAKLGAIAGGARRAGEKDRAYDQAYERCMTEMRYNEDKTKESSDE